jgi:hypothetical protein
MTKKRKTPGAGEAPGGKAKPTSNDGSNSGPQGKPQDAIAIARAYLTRTPPWHPVPVPYKQKGPKDTGWPKFNITLENVGKYFNSGLMNVGVQMGPKSDGLTDADLDCSEAVALAPYFLPETPAKFGRASSRRAHWLYYCDGPEPQATVEFHDEQGAMIMELRLGAGDKGAQTVFPGSVHESGEPITWDEQGEPVRVNYGELKPQAVKVVCGALLVRHWPVKGGRHTTGLVLGGFLARAGWDLDTIKHFVRAVATVAGDEEVEDRVRAAEDSYESFTRGDETYGLPKLREMLRIEAVADKIAEHLQYIDPDEEVDELNKTYAVVRVRGQAVVLEETTTVDGHPTFNLMNIDDFKAWLGNKFKTVTKKDGGLQLIPLAKYWLAHEKRRQYLGLVFRPGQCPSGYFNLWQGFAVEPKLGDCSKFLAHLKDNVCNGDEGYYKWVVGFFADIIQHPTQKKGTSLVLRGKAGVGKTKVGEVIGSLLGPHYFLAAAPRYIVGQFNAHLAALLVLHADEGFWAGEKAAESKLKDMITGGTLPIEFKRKEVFSVENYMRLFVTGNADWQVPAAMDDRRFAVFDVGEVHKEDHAYFAAIDEEMNNGGREALLHYLQTYDLSTINLRITPKTTALLEQKTATFNAEQDWWYDVLERGALPGLQPKNQCPTDMLHRHYIKRTEQIGAKRRSTETKLGMFLRKAVGGVLPRSTNTPHMYTFPPLQDCRAHWAKLMQATIKWDDPKASWQLDEATW